MLVSLIEFLSNPLRSKEKYSQIWLRKEDYTKLLSLASGKISDNPKTISMELFFFWIATSNTTQKHFQKEKIYLEMS